MINRIVDISQRKAARIAGLLYLIVIVSGVFAQLVRQSLIVPGDAAATAHNILASESLFRLGFVSDLIQSTCWLLLPFALYVLLKPVNKNFASIMVLFVLAGVAMQCINMLNQFAALLLLRGADYLKVFQADQLHALTMFFLNMHKYGYSSAGIFHGLWLLPLGYLVFKSNYFPRIFGVLLIIACFGFLVDFFTFFLFPSYAAIISPIVFAPAAIAKFSFCGWLLIKGVKIPDMKSRR
ncbi:hypothetical protein ES705_16493 [subsurface metagenome]|nr:DUF4386 family protein [Methanosarcinales archaeon]